MGWPMMRSVQLLTVVSFVGRPNHLAYSGSMTKVFRHGLPGLVFILLVTYAAAQDPDATPANDSVAVTKTATTAATVTQQAAQPAVAPAVEIGGSAATSQQDAAAAPPVTVAVAPAATTQAAGEPAASTAAAAPETQAATAAATDPAGPPSASDAAAASTEQGQNAPDAATTADTGAAIPAADGSGATSAPAEPAVASTESPAAAAETPTADSTSAAAPVAVESPAASQIVQVAPAAASGSRDDINPEGACKADIAAHCDGVEFAEGQVADCLGDYQRGVEAETEDVGSDAQGLSADCNEEVMQFKINRNSNINNNKPLAKACAADANKYCNVTWYTGYRNGSVIACLREIGDKLQPECQKQVFRVQLDASYDYRSDQMLHEACHEDAEKWCPGVKLGGSRIQDCLRNQRLELGYDCSAELFRKEVEDTNDIRLSTRLYRSCLADKKQYCADVAPGQAMVKQCLEEHLEQLSVNCREEIDSMIEQRVRSFRLNSRLKRACKAEIYDTCAYLGDMDTLSDYDALVINCLQDFSGEFKSKACQMQVQKNVELAAQDIRFDVPLADACFEDRTRLCALVPPGSARVIRCLQTQRDKLSVVCRATLMSEEMRFSENIDFQYPMKQACLKEIDVFCKDVPHGNARVIRCLQLKKDDKHFGKACRVEVERYEQEAAKDYRLNYRLYNACKADVGQICKDACKLQDGEICGGKVVSCLSDNKASIRSEACRKEVTYLEKLEVNDFRTDMQLAEACRADVNKFCSKVEPGEGRVHKCLRDNVAQLSQACKKEELRLEEKEAESIQLSTSLLKTCAAERGLFCRGVAPGSARVFRCLAGNMASADFGKPCKEQIMQKLKRRDANWRLDPPLRTACKEDVGRLCSEQDGRRTDDASVKKCLIAQHSELSQGCQRELGRSLHMSFFVWQPKGVVTAPCDEDIEKLCLSKTPGVEVAPGAVSVCLAEIVEKMQAEPSNRRRLLGDSQSQQGRKQQPGKPEQAADTPNPAASSTGQQQPQHQGRFLPQLSQECYQLAVLAEPPRVDQSYDVKALAYSVLKNSLEKVEQTTGLPTVTRNKQGGVTAVSLTGWSAIAGVAALVLVMLAGATLVVRQYLGQRDKDGYTLVMKQAPMS